jgi:hypothetical protein
MATVRTAQNVRTTLAVLFTLFLLINAIFQTLAVVAGLRQTQLLLTVFNEDTSPSIRLIVFLIGCGVSWLLARTLYKFMLKGRVAVGDSTNTAFVLFFYFLLIFATLAFLNVITWFWLPVLFLILLVYTIFTLWSLVGGALTALAGVITLMAIIFTFLVTR